MATHSQAVVDEGLSLVVFGDWFEHHVLNEIGFFDSNTQRKLAARTGGANVPELNNLLRPFGISFSTTAACFYAAQQHDWKHCMRLLVLGAPSTHSTDR